MTEGIIIALITGGLGLTAAMVRLFLRFRQEDLGSHDTLHQAVHKVGTESTAQHVELRNEVRAMRDKFDHHVARYELAEAENQRVHDDLLRSLGRVEGKIGP